MSRPLGSRILGDHVIVSGATAEWLTRRGVLQRLVEAEGERLDPAVYEDLLEIRLLATTRGRDAGTAVGTVSAPTSAPDRQSLMTTRAVADLTGLKVRAIVRAISEHRLPAQRIDGRWYVPRADAAQYRGDTNGC